MLPKLHTIYRSSGGENPKRRPPFYSKDTALRSFLTALVGAPDGDRVYVNDGSIPESRAAVMAGAGEVITLPGVGNCRSFRACIGIAEMRDWRDEDLVYFAEDDYLHLPHALTSLAAAADTIASADYFTLYDHPDYYRMARHRLFMMANRGWFDAGGRNWRQVRSTCLTFGARLGALREDAWVHHLCSRYNPPADYAIWAILGGRGVSFAIPRLLKPQGLRSRTIARGWLDKGRGPARRVLYAARPSLASHLQQGMLAAGVDWAEVASRADPMRSR